MMLPTEYFLYQTVHKKPIPYAVQNAWLDKHQFWVALTQHHQSNSTDTLMDKYGICRPNTPFGCGVAQRMKQDLVDKGFGLFVLHKRLVQPDREADYLAFFELMFGAPIHQDSEVVAYAIR